MSWVWREGSRRVGGGGKSSNPSASRYALGLPRLCAELERERK